jgi:Helix-turn-helix domain
MKLFEWGVTSKATRTRNRLVSVGITDAAHTAHARMLQSLDSVSAGELAKGWITTLALHPDRLTYDRLEIVTRVTRNKNGELRWESGSVETASIGAARPGNKVVMIDGALLQQLRNAKGLSREFLAWTAGLGITTLARLESQIQPRCRYQTIERLAAILGENPRAMTRP